MYYFFSHQSQHYFNHAVCRLLNLFTSKGMRGTALVFKHNLLGYHCVTIWDNSVTTVITVILPRWKGSLHILVTKLTYLKGIMVIKHLVAIVRHSLLKCLYMVLTRAAWNMNSGCFVYCDIFDQAMACSVYMLSYIFY